jgi:hypothetical protein
MPGYFLLGMLRGVGVVSASRASSATQTMAAITFIDTYFVADNKVADEALHFNELVHVVQ